MSDVDMRTMQLEGELTTQLHKKDHHKRRTLWRDGEQEHDLGAWHTLVFSSFLTMTLFFF